MDTNSVVLSGRLTRDAELKFTQTGTAIAKFSLANNQKKKSGEAWVDDPHFFDVVIMGKSAESLHRFLVKGKQVNVSGKLKQNRWKTDTGESRQKVEIFCIELQLIGGTEKKEGQNDFTTQETSSFSDDEIFDDDVPF